MSPGVQCRQSLVSFRRNKFVLLENTRETGWPEGPFVQTSSITGSPNLLTCSRLDFEHKQMQTFRYFLHDLMDPSPMMSDRGRSLKKHVFLSYFRTRTSAKSSKVASNFPILLMIGDLSVTDRQTDTQTDRQTDTEHHQNLSSPTQKALRAKKQINKCVSNNQCR